MVRLLFFVAFAGLLTASSVQASPDDCRSRTGHSAVMMLPSSLEVTVNGRVLESGVTISSITPANVCAGTATWNGANEALVLWADDSQTADADGFMPTDPIALKLRDEVDGNEYSSANAHLEIVLDGDPAFYKTAGGFQKDGIYRLASVAITTKPAIPAAVSPLDGATEVGTTTELAWSTDPTSPTYLIQVATDSDFSSLVISKDVTSNTFLLTGLKKAKTYYWRIRASNVAGTTSWSPTYRFRTVSSAPSKPVRTQSVLSTSNAVLVWASSPEASSYVVQVASNNGFEPVMLQNALTDTTLTVGNLLPNSTYYWRVQARDGSLWSEWSTVTSFTTSTVAPSTAPAQALPEAGFAGTDSLVTFTWSPVDGASEYRLRVFDASSSLVADTSGISDSRVSLTLPAGERFEWEVQAANGGGAGPWSGRRSFTIEAAETSTSRDEEGLPGTISLSANYPNPFNPTTTIPFELPTSTKVRLVIYNMLGVEQAVLVDGQLNSGRHEIRWNAMDAPSGAYVCRLEAGETIKTITLMLVK